MRIAEVDRNPSDGSEVLVHCYFTSLVRGDALQQLGGQSSDHLARGLSHGLRTVVIGQAEQSHESGGALDESDHCACTCFADDEVTVLTL